MKTEYAYNVRSWTKGITGPLFNESLYYNDSRANGTNVSCYNDNISGMDWSVFGYTGRRYNFSYDNLSRLTFAAYLEGNTPSDKFTTSYSNNKHGNMLSMSRHGNVGTSTYGIVDDLSLSYNGNQLMSVEDKGTNPGLSMSMDFKDSSHEPVEYAYDGNGNMVKDLNKGILLIEYNFLNLPSRVTFRGLDNPVNEYVYSGGGKKLSVIHKSSTKKRTDYVGNMIYENGSLKRILVDGGYIENGIYYFYLQDHLGNNRVVAKSDGTVVQTNHYYPYGMLFAESTYGDKQPYKYNGKELDRENGLNLYDYEARQMEVLSGRFTSVDPMAERYYTWSPYTYCLGNPMKYIDPNGLDSYIILYSNSDSRFKAAAETRQREIMNSKSFNSEKDHIYMINIGDLGDLGERIQNIVNDARANGYGMTVEASFYTHGGTDGPVGDKITSGDYNLRNVSGSGLDRNQLSGEGWKKINWNFDPENSVAAFYGCHTAGFAERFFDVSNVAFTAGQGGSSGPSYKTDDFDSVSWLFGNLSKNIYYGSRENGKFIGVTGYARNQYEKIDNRKIRKIWEINGNVTIKNNSLIRSR